MFGLNPEIIEKEGEGYVDYLVYPPIVTATTSLSGKELAYSLNFPKKSISGFPVLECAEFGRNVVSYEKDDTEEKVDVGNIFHMKHSENNRVLLSKKSFASHTFVTGSTGSGKSNTIYKILEEVYEKGIKFLVVEPAKGEYKAVFGNREDVNVYGTNPIISKILRINPFSFPDEIHILEHLDRLVEIFNVCWPMYAAMPAVLKNAVEKSYLECGWNLITSENEYDEKIYPTFNDVAINLKTSDYYF
ncbi:MAG: ATP-binding protein [Lachnospiraceae bacterium]|nr:ATP-binding protein [Lachnospiraceae bacterium]